MTKYHRLGGLNNRNLFSHSSGGWDVQDQDDSLLIPSESSLPDLRELSGVSHYENSNPMGSGPHPKDCINLNYFPILNTVTFGFWKNTVQSRTVSLKLSQ